MVWKILLIGSAVLFVMKLFFLTRLKEWGKKLDGAVNLTLVLLVLSYVLYFASQWLQADPAPATPELDQPRG